LVRTILVGDEVEAGRPVDIDHHIIAKANGDGLDGRSRDEDTHSPENERGRQSWDDPSQEHGWWTFVTDSVVMEGRPLERFCGELTVTVLD
jgi:hypothetical protein